MAEVSIEQALLIGIGHYQVGRLAEAETVCRQILAIQPAHAGALHLLGATADRMGNHDLAAELIRQAVAIAPDNAEYWCTLATIQQNRGKLNEAIVAFRRTLSLQPDHPDARDALSDALMSNGQFDEAFAVYEADPGTSPKASAVEQPSPNKLPYIGDRVILLSCSRAVRQALAAMGVGIPNAVDRDAAEAWLNRLSADTHLNQDQLAAALELALMVLRNVAARTGTVCAVWMEEMPAAIAQAIRRVAGGDLVEVAAASVDTAARQIGALARALPETDGQVFAVCSIRNGPVDLLPHWLEHYSKLGVDRILLGLFEDLSPEVREEIDRCAERWRFATFRQTWKDVNEPAQEEQRRFGCRINGATPGTWILHTDLDEFHEFPAPLRQIISAAADQDVDTLFGWLLDRVAADGSLPPVRPAPPSLFDQFPVGCRLTARILRGSTRKIMLSRFEIPVGCGHHLADTAVRSRTPLGRPEQYIVHHFKWHGDLVPRMRWSLAQPNTHPQWRNEAQRFLKWLESNGGRIRVDECYEGALALPPESAEICFSLGTTFMKTGRIDEAIGCYQRAVALKPAFFEAHWYLGRAWQEKGRPDEVIACYERALSLRPNEFVACNNIGVASLERGKIDDAIAAYRRAIQLKPNYVEADCNLVYVLHFHPDHDAAMIRAEQARWHRQHAEPLKKLIRPNGNARTADRRLRIGYVSPDFSRHPVGRFMLPLLSSHDRRAFEIFCYAQVPQPDPTTAQLRSYADTWRSIVGLSDEQVAEMIRQEGIDILVDLAMHTANNRLLVFARKPAPVQVSFLGYPGSTGLDAIGYRLTDPYLEPVAADEAGDSERAIRLPNTFWCYPRSNEGPEVNALPCRQNGFVTFGCLNAFCKLNDGVLSLWGRVMQNVPGSRFMLLAPEGSSRQRVLDRLGEAGVSKERVEFVAKRPRSQYMRLYHRLDISLDTFPYNGHTTSLDSFWMGVPVVTLVGQTVVGRAGLSQLMNLNLPELIGHTPDEFVRIAIELAGNLARLEELRSILRQRMENSPLMDAEGYAKAIENAYRGMWRKWCERD